MSIHTNTPLFDNLPVDKRETDATPYELPEEIVLQLSHRDVYLGFFKNIKRNVMSQQAGDPLMFRDNILYSQSNTPVAKLSLSMQDTLADWIQRGYRVKSATVRFIVAWRGKDAPKEEAESAVLLPDIVLIREAVDNRH